MFIILKMGKHAIMFPTTTIRNNRFVANGVKGMPSEKKQATHLSDCAASPILYEANTNNNLVFCWML